MNDWLEWCINLNAAFLIILFLKKTLNNDSYKHIHSGLPGVGGSVMVVVCGSVVVVAGLFVGQSNKKYRLILNNLIL